MISSFDDFFRKPETTVVLPAGNWYENGEINFTGMGEVSVQSMLPADEIMLLNPDLLVSGTAIAELIKSCVPNVSDPYKLYYPDVNVILLAIQKATYGRKITQDSFCPQCYEKREEIITEKMVDILTKEKGDNFNSDLKLTEAEKLDLRNRAEKESTPIINEMVENKKININPITMEYEYDDIISKMTMLPDEKVVDYEGSKFYLAPFKLSDKIDFVNVDIKTKRILKEYSNYKQNGDFVGENYLKVAEDLMNQYKDLCNLSTLSLSKAIKKITLNNGLELIDSEKIGQILLNCNLTLLSQIRTGVEELNSIGIPSTLEFECDCCGHKWQEKFNGYNQSDFFGLGS